MNRDEFYEVFDGYRKKQLFEKQLKVPHLPEVIVKNLVKDHVGYYEFGGELGVKFGFREKPSWFKRAIMNWLGFKWIDYDKEQ